MTIFTFTSMSIVHMVVSQGASLPCHIWKELFLKTQTSKSIGVALSQYTKVVIYVGWQFQYMFMGIKQPEKWRPFCLERVFICHLVSTSWIPLTSSALENHPWCLSCHPSTPPTTEIELLTDLETLTEPVKYCGSSENIHKGFRQSCFYSAWCFVLRILHPNWRYVCTRSPRVLSPLG